jgi:hypothetical protein
MAQDSKTGLKTGDLPVSLDNVLGFSWLFPGRGGKSIFVTLNVVFLQVFFTPA